MASLGVCSRAGLTDALEHSQSWSSAHDTAAWRPYWANFQPGGAMLSGPTKECSPMLDLTPALPPQYRRRALAALEGLVTRARGEVARHLATSDA